MIVRVKFKYKVFDKWTKGKKVYSYDYMDIFVLEEKHAEIRFRSWCKSQVNIRANSNVLYMAWPYGEIKFRSTKVIKK